jgi:hypothetical protein
MLTARHVPGPGALLCRIEKEPGSDYAKVTISFAEALAIGTSFER